MKRIIALLLAALLMVSCALADVALRGYDAKSGYVYVTLGQCPQDADGGVEPIVWRVLSVEDGRAYLLSEYVLEARPHPQRLSGVRQQAHQQEEARLQR